MNSDAMRKEIKDRELKIRGFKIRRDIEVVPNGVDTDAFKPSTEQPVETEQPVDNNGYILFVGRLVEQKGVEYLLRAFLYVREKFPKIRLMIVGDGKRYEPVLRRLATNLGISEQTDFLGWKEGAELIKLYQAACLVVVPSIDEPFGMTALEAMACQRPVVVSNIGGLPEIVKEDRTIGFLSEPKSHLDLAQWIMALLANPTLRHQMGKSALERACDACYRWSSIAQKFIGFYERLSGEEIDREIPEGATAFRSQIEKEAIKQDSAPSTKQLLNDLFSWMEKS